MSAFDPPKKTPQLVDQATDKEDPPDEIFASKNTTGVIQAAGQYDLDALLEKYGASEEVELTDEDIDLAKALAPRGARGMRLKGYEKASKEHYVTAENWSLVLRALKAEETLRVNEFCAGLKASQPYLAKNMAPGYHELIPRILQTYNKASTFQKAILAECISLFVGTHQKHISLVLEQIMLCFQPPAKTKSRVGVGASAASDKKKATPPGTKFHEDIADLLHTLYLHYGSVAFPLALLKSHKVFDLLASSSVSMRRSLKMIVLYVYFEQGVLFKEYIEKICADLGVNKTTQQEIIREMSQIDQYMSDLRANKKPEPSPYHVVPTRTVQGLKVDAASAAAKLDPLSRKGPEVDFFRQMIGVFKTIDVEKAKAAAKDAENAGSGASSSAPSATPFGDTEGKKDWQYELDKLQQILAKHEEYKNATFTASTNDRIEHVFSVIKRGLASPQNGVKMAALSALRCVYSDLVLFAMACVPTLPTVLPALLNLFMDNKSYMRDIVQTLIGVIFFHLSQLPNATPDRLKHLQHSALRDYYAYCLKMISMDDAGGKKTPTHFTTSLLNTIHAVVYVSDLHQDMCLFRPLDKRFVPTFHNFVDLVLRLTDALDDKVRREAMNVLAYFKQLLPSRFWKSLVLDQLKMSEKRLLLLEKACMSAKKILFYDEIVADTDGGDLPPQQVTGTTGATPAGQHGGGRHATTITQDITVQEFSRFFHHTLYGKPPALEKVDWKSVEALLASEAASIPPAAGLYVSGSRELPQSASACLPQGVDALIKPQNVVNIAHPPFDHSIAMVTLTPAVEMPAVPLVLSSVQQVTSLIKDILLYPPTAPAQSTDAVTALDGILTLLTAKQTETAGTPPNEESTEVSDGDDNSAQDTLHEAFTLLFTVQCTLHPVHKQHFLRLLLTLFSHVYGAHPFLSTSSQPAWEATEPVTNPEESQPGSSSEGATPQGVPAQGKALDYTPQVALWQTIIQSLQQLQCQNLGVSHAVAVLDVFYHWIQAYPPEDLLLLELLQGLSLHTPIAVLLGHLITLFELNTKLTAKIEPIVIAVTALVQQYNVFNHTGNPLQQSCDKLVLSLAQHVHNGSASSSLQKLAMGLFKALYLQALVTPRDASIPSIAAASTVTGTGPEDSEDPTQTPTSDIETFGPLLKRAIVKTATNPMLGRKLKAELDAVDTALKAATEVLPDLPALKPIGALLPAAVPTAEGASNATTVLEPLPPVTKTVQITIEVAPPPPADRPTQQLRGAGAVSSTGGDRPSGPTTHRSFAPYFDDDDGGQYGDDIEEEEDTMSDEMKQFFGGGPANSRGNQRGGSAATTRGGRPQRGGNSDRPKQQQQQQAPRQQRPAGGPSASRGPTGKTQSGISRQGHPPQKTAYSQPQGFGASAREDERFDINTALPSIIMNIQSKDPLKREQALQLVLTNLTDEYAVHTRAADPTEVPHIFSDASIDALVNPLLITLNDPTPKNQSTTINILIYLFCTYDLEMMKHFRIVLPAVVKATSNRRTHTEAMHILRIAADLYRFNSIFTSVLSGFKGRGNTMDKAEVMYDYFHDQFTAMQNSIQEYEAAGDATTAHNISQQIQMMASNSDLVGIVVDGQQHRLHEIRSAASTLLLLLCDIVSLKRICLIIQKVRPAQSSQVIKFIHAHRRPPSKDHAGGTRTQHQSSGNDGGDNATSGFKSQTERERQQQSGLPPSIFKSSHSTVTPPGASTSGEGNLQHLLPADVSLLKDHIRQTFIPSISDALLSPYPTTINTGIDQIKQYALLMVPPDQAQQVSPQCIAVLKQYLSHIDVVIRYCSWKLLDSPTATAFAVFGYISALLLSLITTSQLILEHGGELPIPLESCLSDSTTASLVYALAHRHSSVASQNHNDFTTRIILGYLINFSSALKLTTFLLLCAQQWFSGNNSIRTTELLTLTYYVILDSNTARCVPETFLHMIYPFMNSNDQAIRSASMSVLAAWFIQAVRYDEEMDVPMADRLSIDKVVRMTAIDARFQDSLVRILTTALGKYNQQQQQQQRGAQRALGTSSLDSGDVSEPTHAQSQSQQAGANKPHEPHNNTADIRFGVNLREGADVGTQSSTLHHGGHISGPSSATGTSTQPYPGVTSPTHAGSGPQPPTQASTQPAPIMSKNGLLLLPFVQDYLDIISALYDTHGDDADLFSRQTIGRPLRMLPAPSSTNAHIGTLLLELLDTMCKKISNPLVSYHPNILNVQRLPSGHAMSDNEKILLVLHNFGQDVEMVIMLFCFSLYSCFFPAISQYFPSLAQLLHQYIPISAMNPLDPNKDEVIKQVQELMSNILHSTFHHVVVTTNNLQRSPDHAIATASDAVSITKIGQAIVSVLLSPILEQSLSYPSSSLTLRTCTTLLVCQTFISSLTTTPPLTARPAATPAQDNARQVHHQNDVALRAINKVLLTMLQSSCFNYSLHVILVSLIESAQALCTADRPSASSNDPVTMALMIQPWSKLVTLNARCLSKLAKVIKSKQMECINQTQQETTSFFDYQAIFPSLDTLFTISPSFAPYSDDSSAAQLPPSLQSNVPKIKQGIADLFTCFQYNKTREQCVSALDQVPSSSPLVFAVLKYYETLNPTPNTM